MPLAQHARCQTGLRRPHPGFRLPVPVGARQQPGRGCEQAEEDRDAGERDDERRALRGLPFGLASAQQEILGRLDLAETGTDTIHRELAAIRLHDRERTRQVARLAQGDGLFQLVELRSDDRRDRFETFLLQRVVDDQHAQRVEVARHGRARRRVGRQIIVAARQQVAALAGLGILQVGQQGSASARSRPASATGGSAVATLSRQRPIRHQAEGHDRDDADEKPDDRARRQEAEPQTIKRSVRTRRVMDSCRVDGRTGAIGRAPRCVRHRQRDARDPLAPHDKGRVCGRVCGACAGRGASRETLPRRSRPVRRAAPLPGPTRARRDRARPSRNTFRTSARLSRLTSTWPIDQPAKCRPSISSQAISVTSPCCGSHAMRL